jgi:hypothetical protein
MSGGACARYSIVRIHRKKRSVSLTDTSSREHDDLISRFQKLVERAYNAISVPEMFGAEQLSVLIAHARDHQKNRSGNGCKSENKMERSADE